jgi:DNA-binding transcriptional regulator YhcF (GntR family)
MEQDIRPNGALRNAIGIEAPPDIGNWRTAHDFAKQTLRRAILRGELPGGTRLIQSDLATQLGVSTTPVREALRDLAGGGLITLDRNRGGVVRELNWHEVEEIDQIQERLRPLAMELAVRNISDEGQAGTWVNSSPLTKGRLFHASQGYVERINTCRRSSSSAG